MKPIAVFPGSFDPVTLGHFHVVLQARGLFSQIILALGENSAKRYHFSISERIQHLETVFKGFPEVSVKSYKGLTVDFCKAQGATFLLRGLRNTLDYEFEQQIARANAQMSGVETVFFIAPPAVAHISSTIVRDILANGGDVSSFIPKGLSL